MTGNTVMRERNSAAADISRFVRHGILVVLAADRDGMFDLRDGERLPLPRGCGFAPGKTHRGAK